MIEPPLLLSTIHAVCNFFKLRQIAHKQHDSCRGGSSGEVWYAQLLLLFSHKRRFGFEVELAFVRWFTPAERPAHARNFRLQPFKWEMHNLKGVRAKVFRTDIVRVESIIGPAFMQQDPVTRSIFYFNHWVGNVVSDVTQ